MQRCARQASERVSDGIERECVSRSDKAGKEEENGGVTDGERVISYFYAKPARMEGKAHDSRNFHRANGQDSHRQPTPALVPKQPMIAHLWTRKGSRCPPIPLHYPCGCDSNRGSRGGSSRNGHGW